MEDDLFDDIFKKEENTLHTAKHDFHEYKFQLGDFTTFPTIWYGGTGSGKTFHAKFCLNEVKNYFPRVVLFSPTAAISKDFKDIIHDAMIFSDLNEKIFSEIIETQMEIASVYRNTVNNIENLTKIFMKCANGEEISQYNHIQHMKNVKLNKITSSGKAESLMAAEMQKMQDSLNEKLILFLKYTIIPKRAEIDINGLSPEEIVCLQNVDMRPNLLIIFDDQQEELKELSKIKKGNTAMHFKNLFTKSRHYFFNVWLLLQDDSTLPPAVRKACKTSVLTDSAVAASFINRSTNGIDRESAKIGLNLVSQMFTDPSDFRKIIYFKERQGEEKFQYHLAADPGLFKVGSLAVNNFCRDALN
jgi:hypothetical protein